jgi:tryptophanyl-tRNA synthetase
VPTRLRRDVLKEPMMARSLSLTVPSGHLTLGNLLGAIRQWVADQRGRDSLYGVADLHALTTEHDPASVRAITREQLALLVAAGLDPERCTIFVQSQVPGHAQLHWLLEATAYDGELRRMIQYKEKSAQQQSVRSALLAYPVLMAADILLYEVADVPVGEDQRQHLELARDLAIRFNQRYGETFVVPRGPGHGPAGPGGQDEQVGGSGRTRHPAAAGPAGHNPPQGVPRGHRLRARGPVQYQ